MLLKRLFFWISLICFNLAIFRQPIRYVVDRFQLALEVGDKTYLVRPFLHLMWLGGCSVDYQDHKEYLPTTIDDSILAFTGIYSSILIHFTIVWFSYHIIVFLHEWTLSTPYDLGKTMSNHSWQFNIAIIAAFPCAFILSMPQ